MRQYPKMRTYEVLYTSEHMDRTIVWFVDNKQEENYVFVPERILSLDAEKREKALDELVLNQKLKDEIVIDKNIKVRHEPIFDLE